MFSLFHYDPTNLVEKKQYKYEFVYLYTDHFIKVLETNPPPGFYDKYSVEGIQLRAAEISKNVLKIE